MLDTVAAAGETVFAPPGRGPCGALFPSGPIVLPVYTQLISVYRQEGRDSDARQVAYERELRRRGQLPLPGKAWNLFLQGTVGYGYKPLSALGWLAVLVLVGTLVFSSFHSDGQLVPVESHHPPFVASIYTLDRLIPVVSFGLRDAFAPSGAAQWLRPSERGSGALGRCRDGGWTVP